MAEPDVARSAAPAVPLTRRASLNVAAFGLDFGVKTAVGLVITPLLVGRLGTALFGTWEMLDRLAGYVATVGGRPSEALRLLVANRQSVADSAAQRRALGGALVVWLICLPLAAAAAAVVAWYAPAITGASPGLRTTIRIAAALVLAGGVLGGLLSVPDAALHGMNLGYKRMELQAGLNLVGGVFTAAAVYGGLGLAGVAGAQVALAAVSALCFWWLARTYVAWFGVSRPARAETRSLARLAAWLAGGDLIAKLLLGSDVLILGTLLSPAAVTTYVLTAYAPRAAVAVHGSAVGAAMPGLAGLIGAGQYGRAALARGDLMVLTWLFATAVGTTILLWNRSFVALWVGREHYGGAVVDLLIVCIAFQTAFIRADAFIIDAALRSWLRVLIAAVAAVVTITLAVALTRALGIAGLCLGVLAGRLIQTVAYPVLAGRCVGGSSGMAPATLGRAVCVAGVLFAAGLALGERMLAPNWLVWAAAVPASLALALGIAFSAGLSRQARQAVVLRAAELLPRRRQTR